MFTIRAGYSDQIEVRSGIDEVRQFFSDLNNFADLMPGVVQVVTDTKGVAHWKIEADIPLAGKISERFHVELAEDDPSRIEWSPIGGETANFLRYSAEFLAKAKEVTLVHFSQVVELRRRSARDLHALAGLAGETLISNEMTKRVTEMIRTFISKAKDRLEK